LLCRSAAEGHVSCGARDMTLRHFVTQIEIRSANFYSSYAARELARPSFLMLRQE